MYDNRPKKIYVKGTFKVKSHFFKRKFRAKEATHCNGQLLKQVGPKCSEQSHCTGFRSPFPSSLNLFL